MEKNKRSNRFSPEVRTRAVRMVLERKRMALWVLRTESMWLNRGSQRSHQPHQSLNLQVMNLTPMSESELNRKDEIRRQVLKQYGNGGINIDISAVNAASANGNFSGHISAQK